MSVTVHPHAVAGLAERGAIEGEVVAVLEVETFLAKLGRHGFRRDLDPSLRTPHRAVANCG